MRSINSKIISSAIVWTISVLIVLYGCSETEEEKAEAEKKIQIDQVISDMVARHNAVTNWEKKLEKSFDEKYTVYTIEVEEVLVRSDNRPILFFVSARDVMRQDNKPYIHFYRWFTSFFADIHLVLECDSQQVETVMNQVSDIYEQYAVVCLISSVQKPRFEVAGYPEGDEEMEWTEIVVEPSDIFVARGSCLDLLFLGDYEIEGH